MIAIYLRRIKCGHIAYVKLKKGAEIFIDFSEKAVYLT